MDNKEIELYRSMGLMPDMIYYQINGKSSEDNLLEIMQKHYDETRKKIEREHQMKELEKEIEKKIENEVEKKTQKAIEKALKEILNELNL